MLDIESLKANPDIVRLNPELQEAPKEKRRKYGNVPTEYKGRNYSSKREAGRAKDLDFEVTAGTVVVWFAQVPFKLALGVTYIADFVVIMPDWSVRVEEVKGFETREWKLKRKLFESKYGHEIKVLT
jgi:hypothetical protein